MRRAYLLSLAVVFLALFSIAWLLFTGHAKREHTRQLEELAKRASGFSAEEGAVERLGQFNEDYANKLLLRIAEDVDTNPGMRVIALSSLAKHRVLYRTEIARLLIPQESLQVRGSAVAALLQIGCAEDCIRAVLHYQERLFYGEPPTEQTISEYTRSNEIRKSLRADADQLDRDVSLVLRNNEQVTIKVLVRAYGLGGVQPSKFALQVAQRMPADSVCLLLRQSLQERHEVLNKSGDDLSVILDSVINKHCTGEQQAGRPGNQFLGVCLASPPGHPKRGG